MEYSSSDMYGNVLIENVIGGTHTLTIVNSSISLYGLIQTEGTQTTTNITIPLLIPTNNTQLANVGFFKPPYTCSVSGPQTLFIDSFDGSNITNLYINDTTPILSQIEPIGIGLGTTRDVTLASNSPGSISGWLNSGQSTTSTYSVDPNGSSKLTINWNNLGSVDLTQIGAATAIVVKLRYVISPVKLTLIVEGGAQSQIETQSIFVDSLQTITEIPFYFIDSTIYSAASRITLEFETIDPSTNGHLLIIDSITSECSRCLKTIDFSETDIENTLLQPFSTYDSGKKISPFGQLIEFKQLTHSIMNFGLYPGFGTADATDIITVDFDAKNSGIGLLRTISFDLYIEDTSQTTSSCLIGATIEIYDENMDKIVTPEPSGNFVEILPGLFKDRIVFDSISNQIRAFKIDYSTISCNAGNLTYGISNIKVSADGSCGGFPQSPSEFIYWPLIVLGGIMLSVIIVLLYKCYSPVGVKKRRRRKPITRRTKLKSRRY